jgi:hypothetical protein
MGIFGVTLIGVAIVASLGLWSARLANAQLQAKKRMDRVQTTTRKGQDIDNNNQDNPDAMLMAAGGNQKR